MNLKCGCCEGTAQATPETIDNPPGLDSLRYRVGTHASFLKAMKARLSSHHLETTDAEGGTRTHSPLRALTTRDASDPSIALLDAWAVVGDVLSFYQERIANEGFLRTATERRSIFELGRLIGYQPRPGVASSVFLAYTLQQDSRVTIPKGSQAQSVPGPGQKPQTFETSDDLNARAEWSVMKPRMTRPQYLKQSWIAGNLPFSIYLKGTDTQLKPGDPVLIDFSDSQEVYRIAEVKPDYTTKRTEIVVKDWTAAPSFTPIFSRLLGLSAIDALGGFLTVKGLNLSPSVALSSPEKLVQTVADSFDEGKDTAAKILTAFNPAIHDSLYKVWQETPIVSTQSVKVYALRQKASLYGHNAPPKVWTDGEGRNQNISTTEWPVVEKIQNDGQGSGIRIPHEAPGQIDLEGAFDKVADGGWVVVQTSNGRLTDGRRVIARAHNVNTQISRGDYGFGARVTRIELVSADGKNTPLNWLSADLNTVDEPFAESASAVRETWFADFKAVRETSVYTQSELLELDEEPITNDVCGTTGEIELDALFDGLEAGRYVIISGERVLTAEDQQQAGQKVQSGSPTTATVPASEVLLISGVKQAVQFRPDYVPPQQANFYAEKSPAAVHTDILYASDSSSNDASTPPPPPESSFLPGDTTHTTLVFANPPAYCYKRDTVVIYGNVVRATHGETKSETLGSGDPTSPNQKFDLKQGPLTYVSAPTASGVDSTLVARVNDIRWHETDALAYSGPRDRNFATRRSPDEITSILFGNGVNGARPSRGNGNITAQYRVGIGAVGNVMAGQISQLATRPLGVKEVINPIRASGGADADDTDAARSLAPRTVTALDRLVSVQDYADFTRTFAGVAKASAVRLSDGVRTLVHVTIAGNDDIPIDETSDLFRNLKTALHRYGDSHQPVRIAVAKRKLLALSAAVKIDPDYLWEDIAPRIRAALLDSFGYRKRELSQNVFLSEIVSIIQSIRGVEYVVPQVFDAIDEDIDLPRLAVLKDNLKLNSAVVASAAMSIKRTRSLPHAISPAEIAFFTPAVSETLLLAELTSAWKPKNR